ncbi:MAG: bifunctional phosphopantothenoylcysteine decarboxylase/phosphopantothenate--cysteine ligase CoaBC [candidate division WOR-3 bacterium]
MRKLILAVTGSIAAYKSLELLRALKNDGNDVWVVMTEAAQKFVAPLSFETLSGNPVFTELFPKHRAFPVHIELNANTEALIVAPATANIIAKTYAGIADDLVSAIILSSSAKKIFVPAMNQAMWHSSITQRNVNYLKSQGVYFIEPDTGELACGQIGQGRFPEVAEIMRRIRQILTPVGTLRKKLVITAGRTEEAIDPIRVITNRATGKIGVALAEAASRVFSNPVLIIGGELPQEPIGSNIKVIKVRTNQELTRALLAEMPTAAALIMACAVCDYAVLKKASQKIKSAELTVPLKKTPDILKLLRQKFPKTLLIGFAVDSSRVISNAIKKLKDKKLDLIVQNYPETIGSSDIEGMIIDRELKKIPIPKMPKSQFAELLVRLVAQKLMDQPQL